VAGFVAAIFRKPKPFPFRFAIMFQLHLHHLAHDLSTPAPTLFEGALAAVRATISRMQSAAQAAQAADQIALDIALQSSSLGRVPVDAPPPHPFLSNLLKQEQELVPSPFCCSP
jgi:hypothetical protein